MTTAAASAVAAALPADDEALAQLALDFSDVTALAGSSEGFKLVSRDSVNGIDMFTRPVASSPVHMMRASVVMPCRAEHFLRYLELDMRAHWDEHFISGQVLRDVTPHALRPKNNNNDSSNSVSRNSNNDSSGNSDTATRGDFVKVSMKHIAFLSPIPLLQNRDFELVVAERVANGVATLKAISPPVGHVRPRARGFVRGVIPLSGFVAVPFRFWDPVRGAECDGCRVTYVALVHPMGLVPPMLVNAVVGKQTSGLVQLQAFVRNHPIGNLGLPPTIGVTVVKRPQSKL